MIRLKNLALYLRFAGILLLLGCGALPWPASALASFSLAQPALYSIYQELDQKLGHTSTVYCSCPILYASKPTNAAQEAHTTFPLSTSKVLYSDTTLPLSQRWIPNLEHCEFSVHRNGAKARKIAVDLIMPREEFGGKLKCWQTGGYKKCLRDSKFKRMEGDLHNLYPSIEEVKDDRKGYLFADWYAATSHYGKCKMHIDTQKQRVQPPPEARGKIARAYLYMAHTYHIKLSNAQFKMFTQWDKLYKPDQFECMRNKLIAVKQGNVNRYISRHCATHVHNDLVVPTNLASQDK